MNGEAWMFIWYLVTLMGMMWLAWGEFKPKKKKKSIISQTRRKNGYKSP